MALGGVLPAHAQLDSCKGVVWDPPLLREQLGALEAADTPIALPRGEIPLTEILARIADTTGVVVRFSGPKGRVVLGKEGPVPLRDLLTSLALARGLSLRVIGPSELEITAVRVAGEDGVPSPRVLQKVTPQYPEEVRRMRHGGTVFVGTVVCGNGASIPISFSMRGSASLLVDAALEAVRQWRFEPVRVGGKPVPVLTTITVDFNIG